MQLSDEASHEYLRAIVVILMTLTAASVLGFVGGGLTSVGIIPVDITFRGVEYEVTPAGWIGVVAIVSAGVILVFGLISASSHYQDGNDLAKRTRSSQSIGPQVEPVDISEGEIPHLEALSGRAADFTAVVNSPDAWRPGSLLPPVTAGGQATADFTDVERADFVGELGEPFGLNQSEALALAAFILRGFDEARGWELGLHRAEVALRQSDVSISTEMLHAYADVVGRYFRPEGFRMGRPFD